MKAIEQQNLMDREAETANEAIAQSIFTQVEGKLPPDVVHELCTGQALTELRAIEEQARMNKGVEADMTDGIGQVRIRVTQDVYFAAINDPRNRAEYGPNPWHNRKFRAKAIQKYPEIVVKARKKAGIVVPGREAMA